MQGKQEVMTMWPYKFVASKILRKMLGSNNLIADFPSSTQTMGDQLETSSDSKKKCIADDHHNTIFVGSWNVGGIAPPDDLNLEGWLNTLADPSGIYVLGFQEVVPLNAGNIVLGFENNKVCSKWNSLIGTDLNDRAGELHLKDRSGNLPHYFECIISKQMVGIFITVWVRNDLLPHIEHPSVSSVGCGIMGCLGNKGSVSVRFCLHETSFCFVCSHLASGGKEGNRRHRNADATEILSRTRFPRGPLRNFPPKILDHDQVIWLGDLNYRIYLPDTTTRSLVHKKEWNMLLEKDQLKAELMEGHVFQGWHEGVIDFAPTYKYYPNSQGYYGCDQNITKAEKKRAPAWCDRIIWFGNGLKQKEYSRGESRLSDHRPVRAIFIAEAKIGFGNSVPGRFDCLTNHFDGCLDEKLVCDDSTNFYS